MPDFVKQNKTAIGFLSVFIILTLASGFYLSIDFDSGAIAQPPLATEAPAKTEAMAPKPIAATPSKTANQAKTETATATPPKTVSSTLAVSGQLYILAVKDKKYEINLSGQPTVYDLMLALKNRGDFDFKGRDSSGLGFFVESINGVKNNSFKNIFWFYYVNGKSASVGISNYLIKPNDLISWKYETAKF